VPLTLLPLAYALPLAAVLGEARVICAAGSNNVADAGSGFRISHLAMLLRKA
jgi:hypothetical protein